MPAWQFWPGHDRNIINPTLEAERRRAEEWRKEEAELEARQREIEAELSAISKRCGRQAVAVGRSHPTDVNISRLPALIPPKRVLWIEFSVGYPGLARRKVFASVPQGFSLSGQQSTHWSIVVKYDELDRFARAVAELDAQWAVEAAVKKKTREENRLPDVVAPSVEQAEKTQQPQSSATLADLVAKFNASRNS